MPVGREFSTIFYNHDPVCDAAMMMNETYRVVDDRCLSTIGRDRLAQAIVSLKMCIKIKKKTSRAVVDEPNGAVAIDLCIGLFISLSMANGATTKLARNTQKKGVLPEQIPACEKPSCEAKEPDFPSEQQKQQQHRHIIK